MEVILLVYNWRFRYGHVTFVLSPLYSSLCARFTARRHRRRSVDVTPFTQ